MNGWIMAFTPKTKNVNFKINDMQNSDWISVETMLPDFDKQFLFRGHIDWKKGEDRVVYFVDKLTRQEEDLDYGQSAYLLDGKADFLVSQNPLLKEVCQEYITHWMVISPLR